MNRSKIINNKLWLNQEMNRIEKKIQITQNTLDNLNTNLLRLKEIWELISNLQI